MLRANISPRSDGPPDSHGGGSEKCRTTSANVRSEVSCAPHHRTGRGADDHVRPSEHHTLVGQAGDEPRLPADTDRTTTTEYQGAGHCFDAIWSGSPPLASSL